MVEVLRTYSKQQRPEIAAISVLDEAGRGRRRDHDEQTPKGIRNTTQPRARFRVLTDDEMNELIECYRAGDSTYALSRRFGIRRETVSGHLRRRGVMRRANALIVLDAEQRSAVVGLYEAGWSMSRVAEEFGVSQPAVARSLQEAGMVRRHSGHA